jgi:hypothetical protein
MKRTVEVAPIWILGFSALGFVLFSLKWHFWTIIRFHLVSFKLQYAQFTGHEMVHDLGM